MLSNDLEFYSTVLVKLICIDFVSYINFALEADERCLII